MSVTWLTCCLLNSSGHWGIPWSPPKATYPGPKTPLSPSCAGWSWFTFLLSTPSLTLQMRTPDASRRRWCKPKEAAWKLNADTRLHGTHISIPDTTAPFAEQKGYKNMAVLLYLDSYTRSSYIWMSQLRSFGTDLSFVNQSSGKLSTLKPGLGRFLATRTKNFPSGNKYKHSFQVPHSTHYQIWQSHSQCKIKQKKPINCAVHFWAFS